ncbi:tetratricopeptide repeat protein [Chryseobacterium sp.]|uniref:tetratricopeptide repeat protein n=1 Tax=Chryseobacterium sp. TaxID=1871047 RepID=UPI003341A21C
MNPRVLELLKNPKNIQSEDLHLLKEEIHTFPYIQNIRALHLYGVHLYDRENYQKELSTTAAYTTDKKILYQLINGVIQRKSEPEVAEEKQASKGDDPSARYAYKDKGFPIRRDSASDKGGEKEEAISCMLPASQEVKHVYVNGERNRILFEGEENFLDDANPEKIDIESTLESGTLVTQKTERTTEPSTEEEAQQAEIEENAGEDFTPEKIIDEDEISSETVSEEVSDEEETSFHETEALVPEINSEEEVIAEHEDQKVSAGHTEVSDSDQEESVTVPDAELSFHGTEAFMPDVKIQANNDEVPEVNELSQPSVNKHEEEMRRLIEEVEKKMKESKSDIPVKTEEPEVASDHEISFAETQNFHFWSTEKEDAPKVEEIKEEVLEEIPEENTDSVEKVQAEDEKTEVQEVQSEWKPMNFESHVPDSLISKSEPEKEAPTEEQSEPEENQSDETKDTEEKNIGETSKGEAPVINVSFFSTDISSLNVEERQKENKEVPIKEDTMQGAVATPVTQSSADSNVPGFINTWQSWLKIDRTEEVEKEKAEIKEKAIETFIENNPRISQLKEESSYVVKEKNDDISHLMTETLANLYFEQKLYTKAIKAYEILIRKNPDKEEYFKSRIQEIKDFRSKN